VGRTLSKVDIMEFLDIYPGMWFKVSDIRDQMILQGIDVPTYENMLNCMTGIIKWNDYESMHKLNKRTGHKVRLYRRIGVE